VNHLKPTISIIIPTHNRQSSLKRTLDALKTQKYEQNDIEVLVVADGCNDNTVEMIRNYRSPYQLILIEQPPQGLATARNTGANHARGRLLLFLDDDIEASEGLVEAHVDSHGQERGKVVIGYYKPVFDGCKNYFKLNMSAAWEELFSNIRQDSHRFAFCDLLFGNTSIDADLFKKSGGFNPSFRTYGREDWEFGARLLSLSPTFHFSSKAMGYHWLTFDMHRTLMQKRSEANADVLLGKLHPDIKRFLPIGNFTSKRYYYQRILHKLSIKYPKITDNIANLLFKSFNLLERLKLRPVWQGLLEELLDYWYWRGLMDVFKCADALEDFVNKSDLPFHERIKTIEINLSNGIDNVEKILDHDRPDEIIVYYRKTKIGVIPFMPGRDKLRGCHLRPILADELAIPFLKALAVENDVQGFKENLLFLLPAQDEAESWKNKLQAQKSWLDVSKSYCQQWYLLTEDARRFWNRQGLIKELEISRQFLERKESDEKKTLRDYEHQIHKNQNIIKHLERDISRLDRKFKNVSHFLETEG
jgi:glycosyltransferase involved in cell wall biosynthesis